MTVYVEQLISLHSMQIFITLIPGGRKITAEVEGTDSVEALRRQIHELASPLLGAAAGSAAPGQQLLMFNDVLEDGRPSPNTTS